MLYLLARSGGTGDSSFAKFGINELFFKFINILIFGLLWNFICFLTTSIFTILDQTNPSELFGSQTWIMDIFKLFAVIGIIISGFAIIGDILQKLSEEKSNASSGASEVAKASSKASSETSKMKNKASRSMSKSTKSFNKNMGQRWNGAGRSAWTETKGQGFKARTGATAKAMFNYKGGGK